MVIANPSCWGLFQNTSVVPSIISVLFGIKALGMSQSWWAGWEECLVPCLLSVWCYQQGTRVTGIWGTAWEVWDALGVPLVGVTPMATLSCFTPEPPTSPLPHGHSWALEQPGGPGVAGTERGTWAQPSQVCHRGQTKVQVLKQQGRADTYLCDRSKSATESTDFLSSS